MNPWQVKQLKKDVRFQRVAQIKVDAEQEFREHFQEFDEVAEASMRIYMSEGFKGVIQPSQNNEEEERKSELVKKAEMMLQVLGGWPLVAG